MRVLVSLIASLLVSTVQVDLVQADGIERAGAVLPTGRVAAPAVWTGDRALLIGGTDIPGRVLNEVVGYEPRQDGIEVAAGPLPSARYGSAAVYTGTDVIIFGGWNGGVLNQIVKYDPFSRKAALMGSTLPDHSHWLAAEWTGTHAYVFGGYDSGSRSSDRIVRYDPATDEVAIMTAKLPSGRHAVATAFDGHYIYVIGGSSLNCRCRLDEIVRYDPSIDRLDVLPVRLPAATEGAAALYARGSIYLFGGHEGASYSEDSPSDKVLRLDPRARTLQILNVTLPSPRGALSAVWGTEEGFIFGGQQKWDGQRYDDILRFRLGGAAGQTVEFDGVEVEREVIVPPLHTPELEPRTATTPLLPMPPVCVARLLCAGPTEVPSRTVSTPHVEPQTLTPSVSVKAEAAPKAGATVYPEEMKPFSPLSQTVPLPVGPGLPVTVCPDSCYLPREPETHADPGHGVALNVGDQRQREPAH